MAVTDVEWRCMPPNAASAETRSAAEVVRETSVAQATNGVCYATAGEIGIATADLERMVSAVPAAIARALSKKAYYFVPLALSEGDETRVAIRYDVALGDKAVCHRNLSMDGSQCVLISTRLMDDKFSVAFEFFINVGHAFVEHAGVSGEFAELVARQAENGAKGETSLDAFDFRRQAYARAGESDKQFRVLDEKAKTSYLSAAFSDSIAIYMLSLCLDVDYWDLREREYPLLAPPALAERMRAVQKLFPPGPGFEFNIFYRRR